MKAKTQKWGNSDGIRRPSSILKSLNIKTNDIVNIEKQEDKIITVPKKEKISLKENFSKYKGENLTKNFTWDEIVGNIMW